MKRATTILMAALMGVTLAFTSVAASAGGYRGGGSGYRHGGGHWHGGHRHWSGHVHFGFGGWWPGYWGAPYWGGYWGGYGAPYWGGYAYSPTVVVQQEPRVYVERDDVGGAVPSNGGGQWWYWCASARGYYPYVNSCTEGWQRVPPQPTQPTR